MFDFNRPYPNIVHPPGHMEHVVSVLEYEVWLLMKRLSGVELTEDEGDYLDMLCQHYGVALPV